MYAIVDAKGDVPGAACHVNVPRTRARSKHLHEVILPLAVKGGAHEIVHKVVLGGHRLEHLSHKVALVGDQHVLEAKVSGVSGGG